MKRWLLGIAAAGLVFAVSSAVRADDWGYGYGWNAHGQYHDDLDHRAYHRELYHYDAHRYPMTYRQHDALHDDLDHDAFHDHLEHRAVHRSYYRPRYYNGFGYRGRGFSLRIGY